MDKKSNENAEAIQELRTGLNRINEDCAEIKNISQGAVQTTVELQSDLQAVQNQVQILQSQKFEMPPEVQRLQEKLGVIDKAVETQVGNEDLLWKKTDDVEASARQALEELRSTVEQDLAHAKGRTDHIADRVARLERESSSDRSSEGEAFGSEETAAARPAIPLEPPGLPSLLNPSLVNRHRSSPQI